MTCGFVATSISGCDVCPACRVVCDSVAHYKALVESGLQYALNWWTEQLLTESDDTRCCNNTI